MKKGLLACCLACLAAGPALGQPTAPLPAAQVVTTPSGATYPAFRPEAGAAPIPLSLNADLAGLGDLIACVGRPDPGPWYVSAEADFLLRFSQNEHPSRVALLNGPASLGIGAGLASADRQGPPQPGGRFTLGVWSAEFDPILGPNLPLPYWGGEVSGFFLGDRTTTVVGGAAVAGLGISTLAARATYDIWGLEANLRTNVYQNPPGQLLRVDLLGGFRYLNLNGDFVGARQTTFDPNAANVPAFAALAGNQVTQRAAIHVQNHFYGGQFGLGTKFFGTQKVIFGSDFKLALGVTHQDLNVSGSVVSTLPLPATLAGPFPTNVGSFSRDKFSYVPQVDLYMAVAVRKNLTVRVGYSLLYWSGIARATDQVETAGSLGTAGVFHDRGLFLHGIDVGLQLSY